MKTQIARLLLCPLLLTWATAGLAAEADPLETDLPITIKLRVDDRDPVTVERVMAPGSMTTIELDGGYALELNLPEDDLGMGVARFVQLGGEQPLPLHVLRKPWRGEGWPTLGYLVCEGRLSFRPLSGEAALPGC